jgi:hypothetical protein
VRRFYCPRCKKTFTRLPEFLLPFKHYVASEIEGVLRHIFDGGRLAESPSGADESTLRCWWSEFSRKLPQWAGVLESRVFKLSRRVPGLIGCSDSLKRLEEVLSRLPALPSRWTVLVKALWWLKTSFDFAPSAWLPRLRSGQVRINPSTSLRINPTHFALDVRRDCSKLVSNLENGSTSLTTVSGTGQAMKGDDTT